MAIYEMNRDGASTGVISVATLKQNQTRKLAAGLIAPAREDTTVELAPEHAAEPIKNMDDIYKIMSFLKEHERYRDYMLFVLGINFGLRASDLRLLRFSNLINDNLTFKDQFPVFEKKTRNTRKRKKNRYITVNAAVVDAVTLYLEHTENVSLSDYMFRSESNNGASVNRPVTVRAINQMMTGLARDLDLSVKMSTHTLRKTFCYWMMMRGYNDSRRLLLLQKMLGHSTPAQTLDYIGLTGEEMAEAYRKLNLGSKKYSYMMNCSIVERADGDGGEPVAM